MYNTWVRARIERPVRITGRTRRPPDPEAAREEQWLGIGFSYTWSKKEGDQTRNWEFYQDFNSSFHGDKQAR